MLKTGARTVYIPHSESLSCCGMSSWTVPGSRQGHPSPCRSIGVSTSPVVTQMPTRFQSCCVSVETSCCRFPLAAPLLCQLVHIRLSSVSDMPGVSWSTWRSICCQLMCHVGFCCPRHVVKSHSQMSFAIYPCLSPVTRRSESSTHSRPFVMLIHVPTQCSGSPTGRITNFSDGIGALLVSMRVRAMVAQT